MSLNGLDRDRLLQIRLVFIDTAARSVIRHLHENPEALAILLARDMEDIYKRAEYLLGQPTGALNLSLESRSDIFRRLWLRPASRKLFQTCQSGVDALNILGLDVQELSRHKEITLFDSGYEGSIPKMIAPLLAQVPESKVLKWQYIWKAEVAPPYVSLWHADFYRELKERLGETASLILGNAGPNSFRVLMLEHHPKWNGQLTGIVEAPVHIMLDLDDTVLKDVSLQKYGGYPAVQMLRYNPSAEIAAKYRQRIAEGETPDKVIHFAFEPDGTLRSSVVARPAISDFFAAIRPLLEAKRVRLFVTSANDFARTQAVMQQLKFDGVTLAQMGAEALPPEKFTGADGKKDMEIFRKALNLPELTPVVAIDDLGNKIRRSSKYDSVFNVAAFGREEVKSVLENAPTEGARSLQDQMEIRQAVQEIFLDRTIEDSPLDRLRTLAFRLFTYDRPSGSSQIDAGLGRSASCESLFAKVQP